MIIFDLHWPFNNNGKETDRDQADLIVLNIRKFFEYCWSFTFSINEIFRQKRKIFHID